jgi:prepilin-type N-terminal cleavage/methylation domain-containing protein
MIKVVNRPAASRRGFTLIEVMIVVIILAVIAGAIIPNVASSIGSTRLEAAASQVGSVLEFCYSAASGTGRTHGLVFDGDGRRFQVVAEVPPDPEQSSGVMETPVLEPVSLPGLLSRQLPEGIVLESVAAFETDLLQGENNQVRILFFPDGTTEFANLYLSDASGEQRLIEVNGFNGVVTISVPAPEEAAAQ